MYSAEMDLDERNLSNKFARCMKKYRVSCLRKRSSCYRIWRQRKRWDEFSASLTDCRFCHYFRITRECFDLLCTRIKDNVGEGTFKSEAYLRDLLGDTAPPDLVSMCQLRRLAKATFIQYGGLICGEVKLAITLRMLAGGSYLDLGLIFGTGTSYPYDFFYKVICHWICCRVSPLVLPNMSRSNSLTCAFVIAIPTAQTLSSKVIFLDSGILP
jgi:hypothetical protein